MKKFKRPPKKRIFGYAITILLMAATFFSLYLERGTLWVRKESRSFSGPSITLTVTDDTPLTQMFSPQYGYLYDLAVYTKNTPWALDPQAMVEVSLIDPKGNVLFAHTEPASAWQQEGWKRLYVGQQVRRGQRHMLMIRTHGVEEGIDLALSAVQGTEKQAVDDMRATLPALATQYTYLQSQLFQRLLITLGTETLIFIAAYILLVYIRKGSPAGKRRLGIAWIFVSPLILYAAVEWLATGIIGRNPYYMLLGYLIGLFLNLIVFALTGRSRWALNFSHIFGWALALISFLKMDYRGSPLLPWDIYSFGTALAVASHYTLRFSAHVLMSLLMVVASLLVAHRCPVNLKRTRGMLMLRAGMLTGGIGFGALLLSPYLIASGQNVALATWSPVQVYEKYGFGVGLAVNTRMMLITQPEGYDPGALPGELTAYQVPQPEETDETPTNIIVIMNETFSDIDKLFGLEVNRPVTPTFDALREGTLHGRTHVSVLGGGTSTSEFEFLTGNTACFLPLESTAYVQYLRENRDNGYSLASHLGDLGYETIGIHPGEHDAWNRHKAYPILGFDRFYALRDLPDVDDADAYLRGYYRDECVYSQIRRLMEEKEAGEKLFLFGVTIQNHGYYDTGEWLSDAPTYFVDAPDDVDAAEYLTLLSISDDALRDFMAYLETVGEPTLLVFFGDHQPRLADQTYEFMGGGISPLNLTGQARSILYETPFFIWHSGGLEAEDIGDISLNYLGGLMMETAGLPMSEYSRFLMRLYEDLPVISAMNLMDTHGEQLTLSQAQEQVPQLSTYRHAQYNLLFDLDHKQVQLFE